MTAGLQEGATFHFKGHFTLCNYWHTRICSERQALFIIINVYTVLNP